MLTCKYTALISNIEACNSAIDMHLEHQLLFSLRQVILHSVGVKPGNIYKQVF